ncbi:MAG: histidinol phosphate phosphatase [Clostridia bacterium]|nr:histidinol phosphate phosphatase [Clostridia bacterium]
MYKFDYHIHSKFSPDSKTEPSEILNVAAKKELNEIIFTDHCECNNNMALPPDVEKWPIFEPKSYVKALESLKNSAPVKMGIGIEIGQATQGLEYADKILEAYDWDFTIGSLHNVRGEYDFCFLEYKDKDINNLFERYFEELYELVKWNKFSVLGHLYYPVRYIYNQGLSLNLNQYNSQISDIFKLLIKNGRGIEINTSGLWSKYNKTIPSIDYIKLYRQCGGEIITIGSDSHFSDKVGEGVDIAIEQLKEAGFKSVTAFEKQKPIFKDI